MHVDELFLHTLEDLEARLARSSDYDLLMAAALLRKLLLDSPSLVDRVNRRRGVPVRYTVDTFGGRSLIWGAARRGDPKPLERTVKVTKDGLLACEVLLAPPYGASVKRLVRYLANEGGAVHAGDAGAPQDPLLRQLQSGSRLAGGSSIGLGAFAVADVVLRGLDDLRSVVEIDVGWSRAQLPSSAA